ncbi:MAG: hypothetical protein NXH72_15855 [Hyphomonadaceae bacterium]|nr:hypothetical protein [Hyphomonadaceae bacterium]
MTIKTVISAVVAVAGLTLHATAQLVTPAPQQVSATTPKNDPLANAAALYATYQSDVTDVKSNGFTSARDIENSLNNLGGHNPEQLTQGWMAYSALVAAQNPEFRAAVLDIEGYYGRDVMMTGMQNDVRYARTLSGGNAAVNQALTAVKADSSRLIGAAAFVKEQAYSLQGSGWAKGRVGNSQAKATNLFASTQSGIPARGAMLQAMQSPNINTVLEQAGKSGAPSVWESVSGAASTIRVPSAVSNFGQANRIARGKEPIADRITTLAAYRILNADPSVAGSMRQAMSERETQGCLNMANLNLQQCVAAAHKHYEVPFCIGEHALSDIGKCIGKVSS